MFGCRPLNPDCLTTRFLCTPDFPLVSPIQNNGVQMLFYCPLRYFFACIRSDTDNFRQVVSPRKSLVHGSRSYRPGPWVGDKLQDSGPLQPSSIESVLALTMTSFKDTASTPCCQLLPKKISESQTEQMHSVTDGSYAPTYILPAIQHIPPEVYSTPK